MDNSSLTKEFNRFVGREVEVIEDTQKHQIGKRTCDITTVTEKDPTSGPLSEIRQQWSNTRVSFPGGHGTADYDVTRLNVDVDKDADNKYRIKDIFPG